MKMVEGPKGDQTRVLIKQVETGGMKLLQAVDKTFKKKRDRYHFLRHIAIEFKGSLVETRANEMRKGAPFAQVALIVETPAANTPSLPNFCTRLWRASTT